MINYEGKYKQKLYMKIERNINYEGKYKETEIMKGNTTKKQKL